MLTAGARYTSEEKEFSDAFTYLIAGGFEFSVTPAVANDYDVDDFSGKLGLNYTGIENTLIYGSISKGFKSGGFQGQLTFNGLVRYEWNLTESLMGDLTFDINYQDDVSFDIIRAPDEALEGSYWLANARFGIAGAADRNWSVYLWGKNIFDETYRTQVLFSSVGFGSNYGMPRTYGIGATFNW